MKSALEQFFWERPADGYEWSDAEPFAANGVADDLEANDRRETRFLRWRTNQLLVRRSTPLIDHPTLFRTFAELEPTEQAFLKFANEFGSLGVGLLLRGEASDGKRVVLIGHPRSEGEPHWRWSREHRSMRAVNVMLAAIQAEDVAFLKRWFHIAADGVRYECVDASFGLGYEWFCSHKMQLKEWLWTWAMGARTQEERLLRFASGWAQSHINKALSGRRGADRQSLTSVRVLYNHEHDDLRLHIVPDTLLSAMWLQCARVLTENPTFKMCEQCAKWFELSPDARRRHSKYCSERCKVANHRAKKTGIIPFTCDHCGAKAKLGVDVHPGFGYMSWQDIACRRCQQVTKRMLPGALQDVQLAAKASRAR